MTFAYLAGAIWFDAPWSAIFSFGILSLATAVYWIDDWVELSARVRLGVSFLTGILICTAFGVEAQTGLTLLVVLCLAAGIANVVLTNIVNFYDGADLNLATFIALSATFILWFAPRDPYLASPALACLAFVVPFAVLNSRPRTIYLGDAGSFAFACFLTMAAIVYIRTESVPAEIAIPLALPALDTFYVLCIRIIEKHDLMTRNYLHLYQKLNRRFTHFGYLVPQVVNALLVLAVAIILQRLNWGNFVSVTAACLIVTPAFYLSCRKLLLSPRVRGDSH